MVDKIKKYGLLNGASRLITWIPAALKRQAEIERMLEENYERILQAGAKLSFKDFKQAIEKKNFETFLTYEQSIISVTEHYLKLWEVFQNAKY